MCSVADSRKLARIHRVRTLQLGLATAEEARARDRVASEAALVTRIAQLAAAVAPTTTSVTAASFGAAAHYRERLHHSANASAERVRAAEHRATAASEATQAAKRDQSAVEKLRAKADAEDALKAIRALEATPPSRKNRHGPC